MIGNDWDEVLKNEYKKLYFPKIMQQLEQEYQTKQIAPPKDKIFQAFKNTPFDKVRVVILGQDPYPEQGVANGLAFSANNDVKTPRTLKNIKKLLQKDLNIIKTDNDLTKWSQQGVFLLNTVLTIEVGKINSHRHIGWEKFTDAVIKKLSAREESIIFVLLGKQAQQKQKHIAKHHYIIATSHPSPLGVRYGFMESKLFSKINKRLKKPIAW